MTCNGCGRGGVGGVGGGVDGAVSGAEIKQTGNTSMGIEPSRPSSNSTRSSCGGGMCGIVDSNSGGDCQTFISVAALLMNLSTV